MKLKWIIIPILILAELGLCAGIIAASWSGIGLFQTRGVRWRVFQLNTISAEAEEEQQFTVSAPATLNVENSNGKITVTGGAEDTIEIVAKKTAWGNSTADAEAALDLLKVTATQTGDTITVQVEHPSEVHVLNGGLSDSVELTIRVPSETEVNAHTNFGAVSLSDTYGDAELESSAGDIIVTDVNSGTLNLETDFGEIRIEGSTGQGIEADTSSGEVRLTQVASTGDVTLSSQFGDIHFESGEADSLSVNTDSGGVKLTDLTISGALTAETDFGSVTVTRVAADSYELHSSAGSIRLDGANGSVIANTDFGDVEILNGENVAQLDLQSDNGGIRFSGSLGDGPHVLNTDFGSIRLSLPRSTALNFDLSTDFGQIQSEFAMTISGDVDKSKRQGTINGGGDSLTAETSSGNITLEILNP